jgi:hypothetical protein
MTNLGPAGALEMRLMDGTHRVPRRYVNWIIR